MNNIHSHIFRKLPGALLVHQASCKYHGKTWPRSLLVSHGSRVSQSRESLAPSLCQGLVFPVHLTQSSAWRKTSLCGDKTDGRIWQESSRFSQCRNLHLQEASAQQRFWQQAAVSMYKQLSHSAQPLQLSLCDLFIKHKQALRKQ